MKRYLALIMVLILALSLTACNRGTGEDLPLEEVVELPSEEPSEVPQESEESSEEVSEEPAEESKDESAPADTPADENTVITEVEVPDITEREVLAAYADCVAFRDYWFRGGNGDAVTGETAEADGVTYWRYSVTGIDSFDEFKAAALELVSEEIFSAWQENYTYVDIDGKLYGPMNYGSGDNDGFSHIEAECVKLSDEEWELKVGEYYFAEYITGEEGHILTGEYTCDYVWQGDGWVFTAFSYTPVSNFAG